MLLRLLFIMMFTNFSKLQENCVSSEDVEACTTCDFLKYINISISIPHHVKLMEVLLVGCVV